MQLLVKTVLNGWSKMVYYTMTHQILALIQQPVKICNCFFKNTNLKNFHCRCQLGNSKHSFKQNITNFPICCCIFLVRMKCSKKKHPQVKIMQNLRILPCQTQQYSRSVLPNYKLKNFKLQYLLNPIHNYKAENLKVSKMHKKILSRLQKRPVTCRSLALNFDVKL